MLIELPDDFLSTTPNDKELVAIENLGGAIRQGAHIVIASHSVLQRLSSLKEISKASRAAYAHALSKRYENLSFVGKFPNRFRITRSAFPQKTPKSGGFDYEFPLHVFESSRMTQATTLIAEDTSDIQIYEKLLQIFLREDTYRILRPSFISYAAGGSQNAVRVIKEIIEKPCSYLYIGVIDSDQTWSGSSICKNKRSAIDKSKSFHYGSTILTPCLEIENLAPINLIINEAKKSGHNDLADFYSFCINSPHLPSLKFFDLKKGLLNSNILTHPKESEILSALTDFIQTKNKKIDCHCSKRAEDCDCIIISGIGDTFSDKFDAYLKTSIQQKSQSLYSEPEFSFLSEFISYIASWCIARKPMLT
jgi:hypothetical protein